MGDFRQAVQVIRSAIGKVVEYREEMLKSSTDFDQHKLTSMYVSVDNKRIGDIEHLQDQVVKTFNHRKERERMRKEMTEDQKDAEQLADDEADEEQQEVIRLLGELSDKNLFEEKRDLEVCHKEEAEVSRKKGKLYFDRKQQLVHTLHADLLVNLYRCEVKLGKMMQLVKTQTDKLLKSQGIDLSKQAPGNTKKNLSESLAKKMQKTKSLAKSKVDLQQLEQTLQEAGKMPPPRPEVKSYEKILELENNKNHYQQALLHMQLATSRTNPVD